MYTWLVELGSGLTGVLSTVTMAPPYGSTIAAQLIRAGKNARKSLFLRRVNFVLTGWLQLECGFRQVYHEGSAALMAWVHASLIGRELSVALGELTR